MRIRTLIDSYSNLFHMAEADSWKSIKENGLLSTSAALDRYRIIGEARKAYEARHRQEKMRLGSKADHVVLRDQKPMAPQRLQNALVDGTTPEQWYEFLNGFVFMWAEEHRLFGLLGARAYRNLEHDVLTINTESLVAQYSGEIMLCHMNSGNTFPMPHKRGLDTFKSISDFPEQIRNSRPKKAVVEVVVKYSVPDIRKHVIDVRRMKGHQVLGHLPL